MVTPLKIWKKIPEQYRRLGILIIGGFLTVIFLREQFIPSDFGELGHYRTSALVNEKNKPLVYAGREKCEECHEEEVSKIENSYHKLLSCETCHGPGLKHAEGEGEIIIPRKREECLKCHEYIVSRPTGFPQVDPYLHNPPKQCTECHNPHDPTPPHPPTDCQVCHRTISSMKSISPHASLECTVCHKTPSHHKFDPRSQRPTKPTNTDVCERCHSETAKTPDYIPKIEVDSHSEGYLCWECHYPHSPEGG